MAAARTCFRPTRSDTCPRIGEPMNSPNRIMDMATPSRNARVAALVPEARTPCSWGCKNIGDSTGDTRALAKKPRKTTRQISGIRTTRKAVKNERREASACTFLKSGRRSRYAGYCRGEARSLPLSASSHLMIRSVSIQPSGSVRSAQIASVRARSPLKNKPAVGTRS